MNTFNGQDGPWGGKIRVQRARGETWKSDDKNKWASARATAVPTATEVVAGV